MSPPFFRDLEKATKDVFNKGYTLGLLKVDVKTKTETNVEFKFGGVQNLINKNLVGSLETKYKFKEYGVSFVEKWNTKNELSTDISIENFYEGLKVGCESSFVPKIGSTSGATQNASESPNESSKEKIEGGQQRVYIEKSLKLKSEYRNDVCALNVDTLFKNSPMPTIKGEAVAGLGGWVIGGGVVADSSKQSLTDYQFSMGIISKNIVLNTTISREMDFSASVYHHFNDSIEYAISLTRNQPNPQSAITVGLGCRWQIDPDAVLGLKGDSNCRLGFSYSQKFRDGISISLSFMLSLRKPMEGNNNLGLSVELEA